MIYATNSTSQTVTAQVVDDSGIPVTGLVAATFPPVKYSKAGNYADVVITLSDLSGLTANYASGGVYERGGGYYRLDVPNGAFTTATEVTVWGEVTGKRLLVPRLDVGPAPVNVVQWLGNAAPALTGDPYAQAVAVNNAVAGVNSSVAAMNSAVFPVVNAINAKTSSLTFTSANKVDAKLTADGLDNISVADPGNAASMTTISKMIVALWRSRYKKSTLTNTNFNTYADDGTTVDTTAAVSATNTVQTVGAAT
jgi:hypothetical protein